MYRVTLLKHPFVLVTILADLFYVVAKAVHDTNVCIKIEGKLCNSRQSSD